MRGSLELNSPMHPRSCPRRSSVTKAPLDSGQGTSQGELAAGSAPSTADISAHRATSKSNRFSGLSSERILGLFFRFDQHNAASPPFVNSEINLAPEHLEVMHGREHSANHYQPQENHTDCLE